MDNQPKINKATLTPEQRDKLEQYQQAETQLQTLEDIAKMTQEIINIVDDSGNVDKIGTLLIDIRETLGGLRDKEAPETPDYAKPVVDAVSKLEKALSASIKGIDVKPQIKVDAPAVNVSPPSVDLKGVERAVDKLSGSFKDAIKLIKIPENDDSALTEIMSNVLDQLSSIDKGVRTKPQAPNTIKVTNPDGSVISGGGSGTEYTDGGTPPANPVGGTIQWNEGGTWRTVSTAKPLPVTASVSTAGLATDTKQDAAAVLTGAVNETAPASDTASSGLNGRLQRIAQRLTSLIALLPTSLGQKTKANSLAVTLASDQDALPVTGTFWQATQPVSGTITANTGLTQPLTDTQLRATPVPVSGTVTATTGGLTDTQLRASAVPVTANAGTNLNTSALALDATLTGGTQQAKITDGTNVATVKAASTAALAADKAVVVAVSPNNTVPVSLATNTPTLQSGSTTAVTQATAANLNATVVGTGTFVTQSTLAAETTKVIGVTRSADGSGNLITSTSNALDVNIKTPATLPVSLASVPSHAVTNAGTFVVQATLAAETTKVIGTVNQGTSPWVTSNATTSVVGNGAAATAQRVTLANDSTGIIGTVGTVTTITNNVNTVEVAPTTVLNGNTNVTTAGTRVVLASSTTCKSVTIKAKAANTGIIYVGSSTVSSANGFALVAGETVTLDIANLTTVNLDASVSGEGVTYVGIN